MNWTYLNVDPIGEEEDEQEKEPFNVSEAREGAYLIFIIFSPRVQFLAQFFSTQKRVNCTKTDFATKQRNLQKKMILQQNIAKSSKIP